jgi:hypothetical protein
MVVSMCPIRGMEVHMKTTLNIDDNVMRELKQEATPGPYNV